MNKNNLKANILSKENIFKAIYSLKSYIYEPNLLSIEDCALYYQLQDHYKDHSDTIKKCHDRILEILDKDLWFNVSVYFKLKKFEGENPKYRPIHTSSLIDMICMVCMLQPLMFEFDEEGKKKKLSGLSQLIPHNFYGNIPSTETNELFRPWKNQYKQYSENSISKLQQYQENHEYNIEVILDLQNFFPTISPLSLMSYVFEKVKNRWIKNTEDENDADNARTLKKILSRLLIQEINPNNENKNNNIDTFKDWKKAYYKNTNIKQGDNIKYFTLGLAQGLPQAYFFGNIAMLEISKVIQKEIGGESLYYVDDSVIFANAQINPNENKNDQLSQYLKKHIEALNIKLSQLFEKHRDNDFFDSADFNSFQAKVKESYLIKIHDANTKSQIFDLSQDHLGATLALLAREASMAGNLYNNMDEEDDAAAISKFNLLGEIILEETNNITKDAPQEVEQNNNNKEIPPANQSKKEKILNRYNKFFSFREKLLLYKQDENNRHNEQDIKAFEKEYLPNTKTFLEKNQSFNIEPYLSLIMRSSSSEEEKDLIDLIKNLEKEAFDKFDKGAEYNNRSTYYSTIFSNMKNAHQLSFMFDPYATLKYIFKSRLSNKLTTDAKMESLKTFAKQGENFLRTYVEIPSEELFQASDSYKRPIVNAYLSVLFDVEITDKAYITKCSAFKKLTYEEVRLLSFARNPNFKMDDFLLFLKEVLNKTNLRTSASVDPTLLPVLEIFIKKIRNPRNVDSMIGVHKLVSGLWLNGSKFLHSYTLHNQDHAIALIKLSLKILNSIDFLNIKQNDYFVLFMACYLHDISMVINPPLHQFCTNNPSANDTATRCLEEMQTALSRGTDEDISAYKQHMLNIFNNVYNYFSECQRQSHPEDSAKFIINHAHNFLSFIDDSILQIVANIGASHGYDSSEVYGRKSNAENELFSIKYLMILIRLADSMDITSDRINYYLLKESMEHLSSTSKFHWISHYITEDIKPITKFERTGNNIIENVTIQITYKINNRTHIQAKSNCNTDNNECYSEYENGKDINDFNNKISNKKTICEYQHIHKNCPLLCIWTHKKNNYLFAELSSLQNYLNTVNSFGIQTKFNVKVKMKSDTNLDQDFFDAAVEYLENE